MGEQGSISLDGVLLNIILPELADNADGVLELDCSNLFHCVVNGEMDLVLDVSTEELLADGYQYVTINFGEDVNYDQLTLRMDGARYAGNSGGVATFVIPEPATSALSLLALAALAARRRRK